MPTIAVVDDRDDVRRTVVRNIEMAVPEGWQVLSTQPFKCLDDYLAIITEENIAVLIVDERLNEEGGGVDYTGHDLAQYLRRHFPDFPIFMVTAFQNDEELEEHEAVLDNVLSRQDFVDDADTWVPRFIRAGQQFFNVHGRHLADLSALAEKSATGEITPDEEEHLRALQATLNVGFLPVARSRGEAMATLEGLLAEADKVREKLEKQLSRREDAKPPGRKKARGTRRGKKSSEGKKKK